MLKTLTILLALGIISFYLGGKNYGRIYTFREVGVADNKASNNPPSSPKPYTKETIEELIRASFPSEPEVAVALAKSESGLNPRAVSKSQDYGVFQINLPAHYAQVKGQNLAEKQEALRDVRYNIEFAKKIRDSWGNWKAWTNFRNGRYLAFMEL